MGSADPLPQILTSRPASSYGRARNTTVSTMLKIAVLAPMPSARVVTATAVNPRFLPSIRMA